MVVLEGAAAPDESGDKDKGADNDENNRYRIAAIACKVHILIVDCEHEGATYDDSQSTELKVDEVEW